MLEYWSFFLPPFVPQQLAQLPTPPLRLSAFWGFSPFPGLFPSLPVLHSVLILRDFPVPQLADLFAPETNKF